MPDLRIVNLCSGSSGNSTFVSYGNTSVLFDVGATNKYICNALDGIKEMPEKVSAIFVTHEHGDHTAALKVFQKKFGTPIFLPARCMSAVTKGIPLTAEVICLSDGCSVKIGEITVKAFRVPHDSADCFGYVAVCGDKTVGIVTDIGKITDRIKEFLSVCDYLIIESNHDVDMVRYGNYSERLKARILSGGGHLSNDECGRLVSELMSYGKLKKIMLAHLSFENNTPERAYETVAKAINEKGYHAEIFVSKQYGVTEIPI